MKSCVVEEFRFVNKTRPGPAVAPCLSETERSGPKSSIEKSGIDLNFRPGGTKNFILKSSIIANILLWRIFAL